MNKHLKTNYAEAILYSSDEENEKPAFNKIKKLLEDLKLSNYTILDDMKINNPKNFGKGYGKEIFTKILETYPKLAFSVSFSNCDDYEVFSGREKLNMNNFKSAPKTLLEKFYIPILKEKNISYIIKNIESSIIVITK